MCRPTCIWGRWWSWAEQAEAVWKLDCSQEADMASVPLAKASRAERRPWTADGAG